ncbi:MAG: hypothetical protein Q3972_06000 [Corynebacterium sp.]|nr:hypothetical protein [Corynebacterium sp.]
MKLDLPKCGGLMEIFSFIFQERETEETAVSVAALTEELPATINEDAVIAARLTAATRAKDEALRVQNSRENL